MHPLWISVVTCLALLFITLGVGANGSLKTPDKTSAMALKFGFFMAVSHFCFYYIGIWITQFLFSLVGAMRLGVVSILMLTMAVKTFWNVFSYKAEDNYYNLAKNSIQLYLSLAAGLNGLLCGIALTLSGATHLSTAGLIALGAFVGAFSGAGFSPHVASIITRIRPAVVGGVLFLILAVFYLLRYRSMV